MYLIDQWRVLMLLSTAAMILWALLDAAMIFVSFESYRTPAMYLPLSYVMWAILGMFFALILRSSRSIRFGRRIFIGLCVCAVTHLSWVYLDYLGHRRGASGMFDFITFELWIFVVPIGLVSIAAWSSFKIKPVRDKCGEPVCEHCGYSLVGLQGRRCPECGHEFSEQELREGHSRSP